MYQKPDRLSFNRESVHAVRQICCPARSIRDCCNDLHAALRPEKRDPQKVTKHLRELLQLREWRDLHHGKAQNLCERLCSLVCEVLTPEATTGVARLAVQVLQRMVKEAPRGFRGLKRLEPVVVWLIDRPRWEVEYVATGVEVLLKRVSMELRMRITPFGTVEVCGLESEGDVAVGVGVEGLEGLITRKLLVLLCSVLDEVEKRCAMADTKLACMCMGVVSLLLSDRRCLHLFPDLLDVLRENNFLFLMLRLTKVAYRLPNPLFLQSCNGLLWQYCAVDKKKDDELYQRVFESEIEFEERDVETREAFIECLFWINTFNYPTCESSHVVHAMAWVTKHKFLPRLYHYLRRVRCDEDHNWFLLCANTYSDAFHPILFSLATSPTSFPPSLKQSFQNEIQESGLLEITQSFIRGLMSLVHSKFRGGTIGMSEENIQEAYIIALTMHNLIYFFALCMHENPEVVQYCEVCGAFSLVVEALVVSERIFKADDVPDIVRLGSGAQEQCMVLLCTFMERKQEHERLDQWPLDNKYIQEELYLEIIDLMGHLGPLELVVPSQKVILVRKRMELLLDLTQYSRKVLSSYQESMHRTMHSKIMSVLKVLKPHVDSLLDGKMNGHGDISESEAGHIEDIDRYNILLGEIYHP